MEIQAKEVCDLFFSAYLSIFGRGEHSQLQKSGQRFFLIFFGGGAGRGLSQHVSNLARGIQCILAKNLACSSCGIQGGISSQQKLFPLLKPFALLTFQIGGK